MNDIVTGTFYNVLNQMTKSMLNVYAGRSADGTNVCIWKPDNSTEQKWRIEGTIQDGQRMYTAVDSDKVLDFYAGQTNICNADIWLHNDPIYQSLNITKIAPTQYKIALANEPNMVLTAIGENNGDNVVWSVDQDDPTQIWDFQPINPSIREGLDTAALCAPTTINAIHESPNLYKFVCRYYCANYTAAKILIPSEAVNISLYFELISVYQDANNQPEHFSYAIGRSDAQNALTYALQTIGQPQGTGIYFAVDFNPDRATIESNILPYFVGIHDVFQIWQYPYRIGVYGSGLVCQSIKQDFGYAELSWLAHSSSYFGTSEYNNPNKYDIRQGCHIELNDIMFDSNATGIREDFGQWRIK